MLRTVVGNRRPANDIEFYRCNEGKNAMITLMIFHEVDDVEHWVASPKREELFGPLGIKVRPFRDPQGSNRIGLIVETPDLETRSGTTFDDRRM